MYSKVGVTFDNPTIIQKYNIFKGLKIRINMSLKEKFKEWRKKKAEKGFEKRQVEEIESKALQEERLKQAKTLGIKRAVIEREEKVKRLRETVRRGSGVGLLSGFAKRISIAAENLGYGRRGEARAPARKKKKVAVQPKVIIAGGNKFQMVKSKRRKAAKRKSPAREQRTAPHFNPFESHL